MKMTTSSARGDNYPEGLLRLEYGSDWALALPGGKTGVVVIHGHGSHGDQVFTRPDIKPRVPFMISKGWGILSPNLRNNAWMSPEAAEDLTALILYAKKQYGWEKIVLCSGSMGGTSNLIYAGLHPELADGVVALGAASDLKRYAKWCDRQTKPICHEIAAAIRAAYHDDETLLDKHSVCRNASKLTMPVFLYHGSADATIPVSESRILAGLLAEKKDFYYGEIYNGNHDSPIPFFEQALSHVITCIQEGCHS
ncbi:MAG: Alpha/beta hydrolase family protein [Lentisphaerae bacterium ADurb.Bin242]|nr:MAG: Alpha/beta hydrolase family protein [Lentisphaerae bacterium ADurb.Bin242]